MHVHDRSVPGARPILELARVSSAAVLVTNNGGKVSMRGNSCLGHGGKTSGHRVPVRPARLYSRLARDKFPSRLPSLGHGSAALLIDSQQLVASLRRLVARGPHLRRH